MIKITCSKCGRTTEAADHMAGQTLYCAGCQSPLRIAPAGDPAAGAVVSSGSPLRMAGPNRSASGGSLCSHCGATMAEGPGVCAGCGYDPRTGDTASQRYQRGQAKLRRIRMIVLLVVLAGVAAALWWSRQPRVQDKVFPAALPGGRGTEPPVREYTPEEVQAVRQSMEAVIDQKFPMITPNQKIDIELVTRQVIRGHALKSETDGVLSLIDNDGVRRDYPFSRLGEMSRIRVDPEFRRKFIEKQVQRKTAPRPVPPAP